MAKISVILPLTDVKTEYLEKAMDSLIHQSDDDFEVIIPDPLTNAENTAIVKKAAEEYVDFYIFDMPDCTRTEAFNFGIKEADGDYILFMDADGFITDDTIEAMREAIGDEKPDMLIGRMWKFGENLLSDFDMASDVLAILPNVDQSEQSLFYTTDICNKLFRKVILQAKELTMDDSPFGDMLFCYKYAMACKKIKGCPKFVYERRCYTHADGFPEGYLTKENLMCYCSRWDEIRKIAEEYVFKDTGNLDGDESYLIEMYYAELLGMVNLFYRYFWYCDNELLHFFVEIYNDLANKLPKEKITALSKTYRHLYLPFVFAEQDAAADKPVYSFIADLTQDECKPVLESLYVQTMPFFELFVSKSLYECENFPVQLRNMRNLYVLDDKGFYSEARKKAKSKICINIRDGKFMDENVLKSTFLTAAPRSFKPWIFAQKRKNLAVKRNLKEKGLNIG